MRIYVTGGTGLVGSNVIKVAIERHQARVFATIHRRQPRPPTAFEYDTVDVSNWDQVFSTVRAFEPEAIVHCAAVNDLPIIYRERALGWRSYVESTRNLTEAASQIGAKMILVSSDWVFDGTQACAEETTPPNPINYYGVLKVIGENVLAAMSDNWAVARVTGVNGVHWARPGKLLSQNAGFGNLASAVVAALSQNQPITVWEGDINMRATPTLASEIGEMIMRIIKLDRRGIFHCCGGEGVTRLELAQATAEVFDLDRGLISPGPCDPNDPASLSGIPVPKDTRLSASYTAEQLGYPFLNVHQTLRKLRQQVETGRI
jgi:dTDP-4-dehydrorhamnose reductase